LFRFNTLCHHLHIESVAHGNDGGGNCLIVRDSFIFLIKEGSIFRFL